MEADDLDAAVSAVDERLADLFSDLKSLVARSDAERKEARGSRRRDAGRMTTSTDWDELFGREKRSDNDEDPPVPRRTPITRPASRESRRGFLHSPWTIDGLASEETPAATRAVNPTKKVGPNLTLRRAVEDIIKSDWESAGRLPPGDDVPDSVQREKEATKELRREMNLMLERRRSDAALLAQVPPKASSSDSRHVSWNEADDIVFIDPSLLEGEGSRDRRSHGGKQNCARAPWGGGGGRIRQDTLPPTKKLWPQGSINEPTTRPHDMPPLLLPGYRRPEDFSVKLSRFEERCASALRSHLETLTIKKRRELLDVWGAVGGGFYGAELSVQIELMLTHTYDAKVGDMGGMVLTQGSMRFVPVQPQPLRRLKLCLVDSTTNVVVPGRSAHAFLGWIEIDYDENGMCDLPPFCTSVLCRRRVSGGETETASRYFVCFPVREHARVFARAVHLCGGTRQR